MPKRNGAKKGHKCSKEFDRFCDECWDRRLGAMNLGMGRALRSGETTYIPQLELENSRSLPDGTDKDSHGGKCNCEVCRRKRKEETRLLRVISGDPEAAVATGAWKLDVPMRLMSAEELDRLTSAVALTFAFKTKKRTTRVVSTTLHPQDAMCEIADSESESAPCG